jgi:hypothetical protein
MVVVKLVFPGIQVPGHPHDSCTSNRHPASHNSHLRPATYRIDGALAHDMKTISLPWAAVMLSGLGLAHLLPLATTVMLAVLLVWALRGPEGCIQAMTLATLLSYLNPAIGVLPSEAAILSRLILVAAALRVLPMLRARDIALLWPVWTFSLVACVLSTVSSSSVPISVMKAVTFAVAASTVITAYGSLSPRRIASLQRWFATLAVVFLLASLATLASPRIAFNTNGTGLQGILNNAQAMAVALAPLAAWQLAGVLFIRGNLRVVGVAAVVLIYAALYFSESRTGMAASVIGVLAAAITWLFWSGRIAALAGRGRVTALLGVLALLLVGALATGHFESTLVKFAFKRAESREVSGAFLESRGGGVVSQWRNFVEQPWVGHGFGVYAEGPPSSSVVEVMGIPISAPIEKGFIFTAVLEETGVLGGLVFFSMLFVLGRAAWRNRDLRWIALFTACIAVNIGECIFLSPGGIGLLDWLFLGLALASSRALATDKAAAPVALPPLIRFPNLLRN